MILKKLIKFAGRNYDPDKKIPVNLILSLSISRLVYLIIGYLNFRKKIFQSFSSKIFNKKNLQIGENSILENNTFIDCYSSKKCFIGKNCKIGSYTKISSTSHLSKFGIGFSIDDNTGISENCYLGAAGGIQIGSNVIMGQFVSFHSQNHSMKLGINFVDQSTNSKGIIIGNNVWIGAKCTILDGTIIEDNTVIAAGSVVNKHYPKNVLIGGIPARVIKEII